MPALSPANKLFAAASLCFVFCAAALWTALAQPWLGVRLDPDFENRRVTVTRAGASPQLPVGAVIRSVAGVELLATDLIEEPDFFDTYEEMRTFFARQSTLAESLRQREVPVTVVATDGSEQVLVLSAKSSRPVQTLPLVFWFQLFAGSAGFLIGGWVLVLRPKDPGVRAFAVMSASFPLFTVPAAVYSTRELAMDGRLFRVLESLNHTGAITFGIGLLALFLSYPRRLVAPRWLWLLPALFVPWLVADVLHLMPNQDLGSRLPIALEMLTALFLGGVQWWATRKAPAERAALRWLGLSVLLGSGLFVFTVVGSGFLGLFPPMAQGYSFGFFLVMDVGLALGLRRYRLFDLNEWSYRLLLWVGGAIALLLLDAALVVGLHVRQDVSLGLALLLCGFVYLPLRHLLFSRLVLRRAVSVNELFPSVLDVAFAPNDDERARGWEALWRKVFDPLEVRRGEPTGAVVLDADGLQLRVPAAGAAPALLLSYPWQGKGLFGPRQVQLAQQLWTLMRHADDSRAAYERGVREERHRIAADLHDDVGARLLSALGEPEVKGARQWVQQAMVDIRSIINALTGQRVSLEDAVAELRHECAQRLASANIALEWPLSSPLPPASLDAAVNRHLSSMVRELTSNAIRHSRAQTVRVELSLQERSLFLRVRDDGVGLKDEQSDGRGMANLMDRASRAGGALQIRTSDGGGTEVELRIPVAA